MNWPFVVLSAVVAGWTGWTAWCGWRTARWPVVEGHIAALAFPEVRHKGQTTHRVEVHYRYAVGGQTFEGRRIGLGMADVVPPRAVGPGDAVPVYYDPRDPARAVLRPGVPVVDLALGLAGTALAFAAALGRL